MWREIRGQKEMFSLEKEYITNYNSLFFSTGMKSDDSRGARGG